MISNHLSLIHTPSLDRLCVVIPAYNEELLIGRCVASVLAAGVLPENVYVVNDRSTDNTAAVVAQFAGVQLLSNDQQLGKLGGLRHAISHFDLSSRYEYLSLLDADSYVAPGYFANVVQGFAHSDTVLVCGAPSSDRCNWLTAYRALEYAITLRSYRKGQDALGVITVAPGCASTYRTSVFAQLDWSGGTLVEDMDLTVQVHRKTLGHIVYTADAVTHTQDPRRLRDYIGQLTRWYSGTWQVMRLQRIPFGRQGIDAEFGLLLTEGLIYAGVTALMPLFAVLCPSIVIRLLLIDQAVWVVLAIASAIHLRRLDVLVWMPTFLVPRYLNAVILLKTFWTEVIRGQRRRDWFSVTRYRSQSQVILEN